MTKPATLAAAIAVNILNKADTDKLITSIKGRGAKLDTDIHKAAMGAVHHHALHGDTTLINRLVTSMPKSGRTNALVAWAMAMSPKLVKNPAKDVTAPLVHDKAMEGSFDAAIADATPFWEFKAREGVSLFSFDSYITSLTKGLDKAMADPTIDAKQLARLQAVKAAVVADVGAV